MSAPCAAIARGMGDGRGRIDELAAVGEGIRGDVEDAHDQRPAEREQRRQARHGAGFCAGLAAVSKGTGEPHGGRFARQARGCQAGQFRRACGAKTHL